MKQIPEYSLVLFPSQEQIDLVKSYKQLLQNQIGWFGSANAAAHITVINFDSEAMLSLHIDRIREFCETITPQNVVFNHWDSFGDSTFFIAPDSTSQQFLDNFMMRFHQYLGFKSNNIHAHMSIARGLNTEKMKAAFHLFKNTNVRLEFRIDAIYIRRFNIQTRQYSDIIEKITFATN